MYCEWAKRKRDDLHHSSIDNGRNEFPYVTYVPLLWREKISLQSFPDLASLLAITLRIPSNTVPGTTYCHKAGLELPNVVSVVTWSDMFREGERRKGREGEEGGKGRRGGREGKKRREAREGKKKSDVGERGKKKGRVRNGS